MYLFPYSDGSAKHFWLFLNCALQRLSGANQEVISIFEIMNMGKNLNYFHLHSSESFISEDLRAVYFFLSTEDGNRTEQNRS